LVLRLAVARVPFVPGALHDIVSQPLVALNSFGQEMLVLFVPFIQKVMYAAIPGFSGYSLLGILFLGLPLYAVIRLRSSTQRHKDTNAEVPKHRNTEIPKEDGATSSSRLELEACGLSWLGYAWMVLFLLPFANLTSWGPSGRMLYVSGLGSLMIYGSWFPVPGSWSASGLRRSAVANWVAVLAAVYCVALGAWTLKRNPIWKDEVTLYQATVREAPQSQCAHLYRADSLETAGQLDAAAFEYRAAIAADPDLVGAHYKLANILFDRSDMPGAIEEYREVVRLNASALAHRCLAQAWSRAGLPDSAAVELHEVVRRKPQVAGAHTELALNLAQRGRTDSALAEFRLAARLDSGSADAHNNLGLAFEQAGLPDSAIREYRVSLAIDPSSAVTLNNLGSALLVLGDARAAIKAYQQALILNPDFAPAREGLNRATGRK
jgi:tetratricopeptide (TPR) repeat protein